MHAMQMEKGFRSVTVVFSTFKPLSVATKKALKRRGNALELSRSVMLHVWYLTPKLQYGCYSPRNENGESVHV